jgi:hypothetical protein
MGKKLAIKGHSTRGKEVIELLKMLGGENKFDRDGQAIMYSYYVSGNTILNDRLSIIEDDDFVIFNLEEFLEKYPFKVGDKVVYTKFGDNCDDYPVTIESMKWTGTTIEYTFNDCVTCLAKDLKMWNEEHDVEEDDYRFDCTDEMIEGPVGLVEEKTKFGTAANTKFGTASNPIKPKSNAIYITREMYAKINKDLSSGNQNVWELPDGYIFKDDNGNVINATKIVLEKKNKYPKTYKECCDVLSIGTMDNDAQGYKADLIIRFQELIIARDAYWKIAGEEMGLGKPWEPDWNWRESKFCIGIIYDKIEKFPSGSIHYMLVFPTSEMRDAFYENFKGLIEQCKELL